MTPAPLGFTFDFNGTLSDDEPIMYEVFAELFGGLGKPLSEPEYRDHLAGLSDEAIISTWIGERDDLPALVAHRVAGYRARVADGSTVSAGVRAAVHRAAEHVPIAVVSGASAAEIHPVLAAAGLTDAFAGVIASDHVTAGKPDPEGYVQALAVLGNGRPIDPARVVAFEDTEAGVAAATAAGLVCIAIAGTHPHERLGAARRIVPSIDAALIDELLAA
jgi:beta-phosphoglucomutase